MPNMNEIEIWYRIQRYNKAKELGLLDKYFPVIYKI